MSDLVERLKECASIIKFEHGRVAGASSLPMEAADEILRLQKLVEEMGAEVVKLKSELDGAYLSIEDAVSVSVSGV